VIVPEPLGQVFSANFAAGPARSTIESSHHDIVKGSGRGGQYQQQQLALGEEGDFAVHASVYGKVQA